MKRHICQGTKCHTYDTKSRVRGTKGNKVLRTRNARFDLNVDRDWIDKWEYFFCDERCMNNWLNVHMLQLINYVGIKTKPSESPIDIVEETRTNWSGKEYTYTTIKLKQNENNVLT